MHLLIRLLPYLRRYTRLAGLSVIVTLASVSVGLLLPWPLKIVIDNVLGTAPLTPSLAQSVGGLDRVTILLVTVGGGLALTLLSNALAIATSYLKTRLEQGIVLDFRSDLFHHAERLSVAFRDQVSTGRLIYAINFEATSAGNLVMALQPLAQSALTVIGMVWITFRIDAVLALLAVTVVPILYYAIGYYATHIQPRLLEVKWMEADALSIIHDAMSMVPIVSAFGREDHELSRFRRQSAATLRARVGITTRQTFFSLCINMTTATGTALVLGFGSYQALRGRLTPGDLLVVLSYVSAVYKPLESISYTLGSLQDNLVGLRMGFHILDTTPLIQEQTDAAELPLAAGDIRFDDVSFAYPGRVDTLKNISFEVAPGQIVAIVGPTGAGKTTLASLLPRFYDPVHGRILIHGRDLRGLTLTSLRDHISIVPQEPLLFAGTIADNIRYGRLDASMEEVIAAARAANAHDFIVRLGGGYDTEIGERGVRLSGGERQRLCIARAFLKPSPILILDEPTASIDSRTESVILDALDRLMVGRTTFMIAHRLSTVRHADLILAMDHGVVVEQGTHDELLRRGGLYAQLHDAQNRRLERTRRAAALVEAAGEPA
ncbi:MAG TPA: ABC transporter ATP-binding protein [Vicinamibacterales bacterium]|nr:ABC transporter ATP-binding protein [Vicinamibacterales bacterium]